LGLLEKSWRLFLLEVNMKKRVNYNDIPWGDYFRISSESPSGLVWGVARSTGKYDRVKEGDFAGSIRYEYTGRVACYKVCLKGKTYLVHRIVFVLANGYIDDSLVVDHINGDPLDNTPSNLRSVTGKTNSHNTSKFPRNKTGVIGVCFLETIGKYGDVFTKFTATWRDVNSKSMSKSFSIDKYGYETAKQLAINHRNLQISLLNAAGASYTERHRGLTPATPPAISPVQPT
jgi:hypothetical protein